MDWFKPQRSTKSHKSLSNFCAFAAPVVVRLLAPVLDLVPLALEVPFQTSA